MSAFSEQLIAALDATANSDRQLMCAETMEIRFASTTVRLWSGTGSLITPDGERWVGWNNGDAENPQAFIEVPQTQDVRSGTSPLYEITLGYIDADQYALLRADDTETDGRLMLLGNVYLPDASTRAMTQPGDIERLEMVGRANFKERRVRMDDGSHKLQYLVTVRVKNINGGRSRVGFSSWTYTGQKFRSLQLFDVADDEYAQFIGRYAGGITLTL